MPTFSLTRLCENDKLTAIWVILSFVFFNQVSAQVYIAPKGNPKELGKVHWLRNYDLALSTAREKNLPIFILFQEVPGCANCTTYGNEVMSHPLIVEAIESNFVPLCIYNNKEGHDKKILDQFNEVAWNNPVVRITHKNGKECTFKCSDFRSPLKLIRTMMEALACSNMPIPMYITLLEGEFKSKEALYVGEAYFSMPCFWTGEKELASIDGILTTEAGFMFGREVVKINYDRTQFKLSQIVAKAKQLGCASEVYANIQDEYQTKPIGPYKKDKEDKYYLIHSKYGYCPMTAIQKTKINRAIALKQSAETYLSPKQIRLVQEGFIKPIPSTNIYDLWKY